MKFPSREEQFFVLIIGRGSTLIRWSTIPTFNCSIMVLSKDQFVFTSIPIECCCTSLYCKNSSLFNRRTEKWFFIKDGRNQMAFGSCSLLAYHRIFPRVDQILRYYQSKQCAYLFFTMSQKRFNRKPSNLSLNFILC